MKHTSSLFRLNPFLDKEGILRVGGRLTRASVQFHVKHPVILPRKGHVTALVIKHYHQRIRHQGRGMTLNELRANGFWITGGSSAVARHIYDCLPCRKLRASPQDQKMADLPKDRYRTITSVHGMRCGLLWPLAHNSLGTVYEFVYDSFRTGNLNCFRVK
jgi:ribosomal protein L13E